MKCAVLVSKQLRKRAFDPIALEELSNKVELITRPVEKNYAGKYDGNHCRSRYGYYLLGQR